MIEVSKFRLADGVATEDFLSVNADFQQRFIYQQEGVLRRTVASGLNDEWVAMTWWRSMKDARRCESEASSSPVATAFQSHLDPASIETQYFKELPG
jgi:hypothetical protein